MPADTKALRALIEELNFAADMNSEAHNGRIHPRKTLYGKAADALASLLDAEPVAFVSRRTLASFDVNGAEIVDAMLFPSGSLSPAQGVAVYTAPVPAEAPAGWRLVPEEPNETMLWKGWQNRNPKNTLEGLRNSYRAMLAAAPGTPEDAQ